jgi:Tfp pilus assembly protein PilF
VHDRLAALLAETTRRDPRRAAEAAHHLVAAGRPREAAAALARAAEHATAMGATDVAAVNLRRALELAPDDPELALALGDAEAWRGHRAAAEAALAQACELLERRGDRGALARAWLRCARWYHGPICLPRGVREVGRRVLDLLDEAALEAPEERHEALAALAWAEAVAGDVDEAERLLEPLERAARDGDADLRRYDVGHARALALIRRGRFAESYAPSLAAAEAVARADRPDLAYGCWMNAAAAAAAAGDEERALEYLERCGAILRGRGLASPELQRLAALASIRLRRGELAAARVAADDELRVAERVEDEGLRRAALHDSGLVALHAGEHGRAAELLAQALAGPGPISRPFARLARAEALVGAGELDAAAAELRAVPLEPVGPADLPDTLVPRLARVQGLLALARGEHALAARRLAEAARGWRRLAASSPSGEQLNVVLADFGRPVIGLVVPSLELARVEDEQRRLLPATA